MFLTEVQQAVARYLGSHAFFVGRGGQKPIPVMAANDKSLAAKAAQSMGKMGLCVIVAPLGGDFNNSSSSTPFLSPARFTCRVRENQMVNRSGSGTGQPGDYVAEVCAQLLQHYSPLDPSGDRLGGGGVVLTGISPGEDEPGITAWDLIWTYDGGITDAAVRRDFTATPLPGGPPS